MKTMIYKNESCREVLASDAYQGYNFLIISLGTHPCAYVELPATHPYYNIHSYVDMDINCHGGLTYGNIGGVYIKDSATPLPGYWIGWDYAHYGDCLGYFLRRKKYSTEEIMLDITSVIEQLKAKANEKKY